MNYVGVFVFKYSNLALRIFHLYLTKLNCTFLTKSNVYISTLTITKLFPKLRLFTCDFSFLIRSHDPVSLKFVFQLDNFVSFKTYLGILNITKTNIIFPFFMRPQVYSSEVSVFVFSNDFGQIYIG